MASCRTHRVRHFRALPGFESNPPRNARAQDGKVTFRAEREGFFCASRRGSRGCNVPRECGSPRVHYRTATRPLGMIRPAAVRPGATSGPHLGAGQDGEGDVVQQRVHQQGPKQRPESAGPGLGRPAGGGGGSAQLLP